MNSAVLACREPRRLGRGHSAEPFPIKEEELFEARYNPTHRMEFPITARLSINNPDVIGTDTANVGLASHSAEHSGRGFEEAIVYDALMAPLGRIPVLLREYCSGQFC